MTFEELLGIEEFSDAKLYVSNTKFNRKIENVYLLDMPDYESYISRGDLVFYTGAAFEPTEDALRSLIGTLADNGAAGLVLAVGTALAKPSHKVVACAEEHGLPLLAIPYGGTLSRVIASTYYTLFRSQEKVKKADVFMRELLLGDEATALSYLNRYHYVRTRQHVVLYMSYDEAGYDFAQLESIAAAVPANLSLQLFSVYCVDTDGVIVVLELSQREALDHVVMRILTAVQNALSGVAAGNTVSAGVSSIFYEPERMRTCIDEAKQAFEVLRGCGVRHSARYYEEIGVYRFFYEFNNDLELKDFVMDILGELIRYDEENQSDYVNTLQVYLQEGGNIGETADKLFVHRNTIKYRMARIAEILNLDLENTNTVFNLRFAYKIRQYLGGKAPMIVHDGQK